MSTVASLDSGLDRLSACFYKGKGAGWCQRAGSKLRVLLDIVFVSEASNTSRRCNVQQDAWPYLYPLLPNSSPSPLSAALPYSASSTTCTSTPLTTRNIDWLNRGFKREYCPHRYMRKGLHQAQGHEEACVLLGRRDCAWQQVSRRSASGCDAWCGVPCLGAENERMLARWGRELW